MRQIFAIEKDGVILLRLHLNPDQINCMIKGVWAYDDYGITFTKNAFLLKDLDLEETWSLDEAIASSFETFVYNHDPEKIYTAEIVDLAKSQRVLSPKALRVLGTKQMTNKICPVCSSDHIVKNGSNQVGTQQYLCKDCNSSFTGKRRGRPRVNQGSKR
jgi:ribosomal protein L37AE/L43A